MEENIPAPAAQADDGVNESPEMKVADDQHQDDGQSSQPNAPASENSQESDGTHEKRLRGAIEKVEKVNARLGKMVDMTASLVRSNPQAIVEVAENDPALADQVVAKLWGGEGIKSYSQLVKHAEMERLREADPEKYETHKKISYLEERLTQKEQKERKAAMSSFCSAVGISDNPYDSKRQRLEEALSDLNPNLVEDNYSEAIKKAYSIAFGSSPKTVSVPSTPYGGGGIPVNTPAGGGSSDANYFARRYKELRGEA